MGDHDLMDKQYEMNQGNRGVLQIGQAPNIHGPQAGDILVLYLVNAQIAWASSSIGSSRVIEFSTSFMFSLHE